MSIWHDRPALSETVQTQRPNGKGPSRLEESKADEKRVVITDRDFKKAVRDRDRMRCRKCGCKVEVTMKRQSNRAEVHHLHGRLGPFTHEDRCALLLCLFCHERVTGKVNDRLFIRGTKFLTIQTKQGPQTCTDARAKVLFERVCYSPCLKT